MCVLIKSNVNSNRVITSHYILSLIHVHQFAMTPIAMIAARSCKEAFRSLYQVLYVSSSHCILFLIRGNRGKTSRLIAASLIEFISFPYIACLYRAAQREGHARDARDTAPDTFLGAFWLPVHRSSLVCDT